MLWAVDFDNAINFQKNLNRAIDGTKESLYNRNKEQRRKFP